MTTFKNLTSMIANREGKKIQVKIGDIREIVSIVVDLMAEYPSITNLLLAAAEKRRAKLAKAAQ